MNNESNNSKSSTIITPESRDSEFQFTNSWFDSVARNVWDQLIPKINPSKILEIGSYEGASTCYLIQKPTVIVMPP